MWKELIEVLRDIMQQYYEILLLAQQKKNIIVSANVKELNSIVAKEQRAMQVIMKLEEKRQKIQQDLANKGLITAANVNIQEIIELCDEETKQELTKLRKAIKQIAEELGAKNKENNALLSKALSFVQFNINLLSQAEVVPTYGVEQNQNKPVQSVVKRALFDQKI